MSHPFFSICVPNYNYAGYIGLTLDSVLNQDFTDFEIIIVDNASIDTSWEIIQRYASQDARIKAFRNSANVGFAPNLQKTSERATGQYFIMLSSDDLMKPGALTDYHRVILSDISFNENIVLHSAADHIDADGKFKRLSYRFPENKPDDPGCYFSHQTILDGSTTVRSGYEILKLSLLQAYSPATFCSTCYPRILWEKVGGYDMSYQYQPDTAFLFKLLSCNPNVVYINKSLFGYRVHGNNQNSNAIAKGAIKQQLDKYQMCYSISDSTLMELKVKREEVEKTFLREYCFKESLRTLRLGYKIRAFKIFAFALSTFPMYALTSGWFYLTFFANIFSFIVVWIPGFRIKRTNVL